MWDRVLIVFSIECMILDLDDSRNTVNGVLWLVEDTRFELGIPNRWSRDCPLGQGIALSEMQSFVFFLVLSCAKKPDARMQISIFWLREREVCHLPRGGGHGRGNGGSQRPSGLTSNISSCSMDELEWTAWVSVNCYTFFGAKKWHFWCPLLQNSAGGIRDRWRSAKVAMCTYIPQAPEGKCGKCEFIIIHRPHCKLPVNVDRCSAK